MARRLKERAAAAEDFGLAPILKLEELRCADIIEDSRKRGGMESDLLQEEKLAAVANADYELAAALKAREVELAAHG